ncbi:MAG: glycosyltransferase family 4 protein [Patescibacteria group bacterium]
MQDKELKVLLTIPFFYPHRGGSQKYAEEVLAPMVEKHKNVKVDVLCYNTDHVSEKEEYRGFTVYRVPCWNIIPARFALAKPLALNKKLKELSHEKYDYVITHIRFFDPTWWAWRYAKKIGAKSIFTGHVPSHPAHQSKIVEFVAKTVDLTIATLSLKKYDYLVFVNKASQKFFKEKLGVKKESFLVYIGVNTKEFKHANIDSERKIPTTNKILNKDDILVLFLGRVIWTKGPQFVIESAKELVKSGYSNVYFVIAGPGELENELKQKIKEYGLEEKVFMTGSLEYDKVKHLYSISDIFVNPSHHNEGLPNTLLEAGSSELLVIASDNGGTTELVINNETGIVIPQKDQQALTNALTWALNNPQEAKKLAQNIRQKTVNEFDWDALSEQFYNLLVNDFNN